MPNDMIQLVITSQITTVERTVAKIKHGIDTHKKYNEILLNYEYTADPKEPRNFYHPNSGMGGSLADLLRNGSRPGNSPSGF